MDNLGSGFGEVVDTAKNIFSSNIEGGENRLNTSDQAELKNCIQNAQECTTDMGKVINQLPGDSQEIQQLQDLCKKAGVLLEEAKQRCRQIL